MQPLKFTGTQTFFARLRFTVILGVLGPVFPVPPIQAFVTAISVPSTNWTYTQEFDALWATNTAGAATIPWFNGGVLPGWFLFRQPAPGLPIIAYASGSGDENTGAFYSFGPEGVAERALGGVGSGGAYFGNPATGAAAGWIAVAFANDTGANLPQVRVQFDGEQWRKSANPNPQAMVFEWGFGFDFTTVGAWTAPGGNFDWSSPIVGSPAQAVDGNSAGLVPDRGGVITPPGGWLPGQILWLRWTERNDPGEDHGLAIDRFRLFLDSPSPEADVAVSQTVAPTNVAVGGTVVFNVAAANLSLFSVSNLSASIAWPAGVQLGGFSATPGSGFNPNSGLWTIASLSISQTVSLTLTGVVQQAGVFTNAAVLLACAPPDGTPGNNLARATVTATNSTFADLALGVTAPPESPVGQPVAVEVTLSNQGPQVAASVVVEAAIPASVQFLGAVVPFGTTFDAGTGRWAVETMPAGTSLRLQAIVQRDQAGLSSHAVSVLAAGAADPNPTDNTASTTVNWRSQYTVTATAGPNGTLLPGGMLTLPAGASQDFLAVPMPGAGVDRWWLDGLAVQTNGTAFRLTNIVADHSVEVTFRPGPEAPFVTQQPQTQAAAACGTAAFTVAATGAAPLQFQWLHGGQPVPNATNATLTLTPLHDADAGEYQALVTGPGGAAASQAAALQIINDVPPTILCPGNLVVPATQPGGAVVAFTVTAVDDCDALATITCSPSSGSFFPLGDTVVVCTADDSAGNRSACRFTVSVFDPTPPALRISRQGGLLKLTWPPSLGTYTLQSKLTLAESSWQPVLAPIVVIGGTNQVTLPVSGTTEFFSLGTGFPIQFVTPDAAGGIVPQSFTYNSAPCPQISAVADAFTVSANGQVQLSLSGVVTDAASDLVNDPVKQLQELQVFLETELLTTVPLVNHATPEFPWKPYRYEASFSANLAFQVNGPGTLRLELKTSQNVAGCAGSLVFDLNLAEGTADLGVAEASDPGTFLPTMLRVDAPVEAFLGRGSQMRAFDEYWNLQRKNFGDGEYWYAVDAQNNATVFLPAAYAHTHLQTKPINLEFKARIVNGAAEEGKGSIKVENGLLVLGDDVEPLLGSLKNVEKQGYQLADGRPVFVYRAGANFDHKNRELATEILWRLVGTEETLTIFGSKAELERDLLYRAKVIEATTKAKFRFSGAGEVNDQFWVRTFRVKEGKSATDAVADIFDNANSDRLYAMACFAAAHNVHQRGASQALGKDTFDGLMYGRDTYLHQWRVKYGPAQPNPAAWLPGDWGYLQNKDPNGRTNANWSLLCGENVIYVGGSFDRGFAQFKKNATFWGHFNPAEPTRKLDKWLDDVSRFTDRAGVPAAISEHRNGLRQPPLPGSTVAVDGDALTVNAFAGGTLKVGATTFNVRANGANSVVTTTHVSVPCRLSKGAVEKSGTINLFTTRDGKSRVILSGIVMTADQFAGGKLVIGDQEFAVSANTKSEVTTSVAVAVPVQLTKGGDTLNRNLTVLFNELPASK